MVFSAIIGALFGIGIGCWIIVIIEIKSAQGGIRKCLNLRKTDKKK